MLLQLIQPRQPTMCAHERRVGDGEVTLGHAQVCSSSQDLDERWYMTRESGRSYAISV